LEEEHENDEDEGGDGGGDVELLVHQNPLRSITNEKRTRRLSIQELDGEANKNSFEVKPTRKELGCLQFRNVDRKSVV
jgi:hypothetical protein